MKNSARNEIELLPDAVTQMKIFYKVSLNSQQDNTGLQSLEGLVTVPLKFSMFFQNSLTPSQIFS